MATLADLPKLFADKDWRTAERLFLKAAKNRKAPAEIHVNLGKVRCTVNLAPAHLRKEGALYDLPIAVGLAVAGGAVDQSIYADFAVVGELGLQGELRPIRGALAMAAGARREGCKGILERPVSRDGQRPQG